MAVEGIPCGPHTFFSSSEAFLNHGTITLANCHEPHLCVMIMETALESFHQLS